MICWPGPVVGLGAGTRIAEVVGSECLDQTRRHSVHSDPAAGGSREKWLELVFVGAGQVTCEGIRRAEVAGTPMKAHRV